MSGGPSSPPTARQAQLLALAGELRPELHRYCARLMGSVIEGEDVVQDTFARAFVALDEIEETRHSAPGCSGSPTTARWTCCAAARSARPSPSRRPTRSPIRRAQILWR
jgi:Sigma-70 region 2